MHDDGAGSSSVALIHLPEERDHREVGKERLIGCSKWPLVHGVQVVMIVLLSSALYKVKIINFA